MSLLCTSYYLVSIFNDITTTASATTPSASKVNYKGKNLEPIKLQIVQVEDGNSLKNGGPSNDVSSLYNNQKFQQLLKDLRSQYDIVDFGITNYFDKRALNKSGIRSKLTSSHYEGEDPNKYDDSCYSINQHLSSNNENEVRLVIDSSEDDDDINGGIAARTNDEKTTNNTDSNLLMHNQWDVLYRTALDDTIGWDLRERDSDGRQIIRMALLITDTGGHTSPETFKKFPRNLSREQLFRSSKSNNYRGNILNNSLTTGITQEYNKSDIRSYEYQCDNEELHCNEFSSLRTGMKRSQHGLLTYYNNYYGLGLYSTVNNLQHCATQQQGENYEECQEYVAFLNCCTRWGIDINEEDGCGITKEYHTLYPDYKTCIEYGGFYADGYYNADVEIDQINEELSIQSHLMHPSKRFMKNFERYFDNSRMESFMATKTYPYDKSIFTQDCSLFEYPDPTSSDYASVFIDKDIIPVILAAPPSDKIMKEPGVSLASDLSSYDESALIMSEHNCPGLEWDPWTTYTCSLAKRMDDDGENTINFNSCIAPHLSEYSKLYSSQSERDNPGVDGLDSSRFYDLKNNFGCTSEHCSNKWWSECMTVEYEYPMEQMRKNGVLGGLYIPMKANYSSDDVILSIKDSVNKITKDTSASVRTDEVLSKSDDIDENRYDYVPQAVIRREFEELPSISEALKAQKIVQKSERFHEQLKVMRTTRGEKATNNNKDLVDIDSATDTSNNENNMSVNNSMSISDATDLMDAAEPQSDLTPPDSDEVGLIVGIGCATVGVVAIGGATLVGLANKGKLGRKKLPPLRTSDHDNVLHASFNDQKYKKEEVNAELFV